MQSWESVFEPGQFPAISPAARILIADDNIFIRELNAEILIQSGFQVDTAEDGAEAWECLQANGYDLLITDNKMPKISGIRLIEILRSAGMTLPVIMISGEIPLEARDRNNGFLFVAVLGKPFSGCQLLESVSEVLQLSTVLIGHREELLVSGWKV